MIGVFGGINLFGPVGLLYGPVIMVLLVARLVTLAALDREESRGAHYREDFPNPLPEWRRHQSLTVDRLA